VVVPTLKLAPVGGFTNPIEASKVEFGKFTREKSPGSWLDEFKGKLAGIGETILGRASKYAFKSPKAEFPVAAFPETDPPVAGRVYETAFSLKPKLDFPVALPP
jgi:hypothetical protein